VSDADDIRVRGLYELSAKVGHFLRWLPGRSEKQDAN